ncbi:DUF692 domain-containing protein [Ramlibacter ginsenosidimutans]|nr:DUF692 family multinuclear iron-containing protein [Ramlibacter ginsenosidimutans]
MLAHVDYLEVTPETIAEVRGEQIVLSPEIVTELKNAGRDVKIVVHGVSLSIGSHNGWQSTYLRLLDKLMSQVNVSWHSEHLGYTRVDDQHLGIMLALPRTEQVLDLVCERVLRLNSTFGIPFLLENIVHVLPPYPQGYSPAAFLNAIAARTGCGLLLDIYNLECDAHNHGLDIPAFLAELNGRAVRELHLACGVEHNGFLLDVHSKLVRPCTVALAQQVLTGVAPQAELVVYEFMPEAVPGLGREAIGCELARLRDSLGGAC